MGGQPEHRRGPVEVVDRVRQAREADEPERLVAPLVPVERVWVETVGARRPDATADRFPA